MCVCVSHRHLNHWLHHGHCALVILIWRERTHLCKRVRMRGMSKSQLEKASMRKWRVWEEGQCPCLSKSLNWVTLNPHVVSSCDSWLLAFSLNCSSFISYKSLPWHSKACCSTINTISRSKALALSMTEKVWRNQGGKWFLKSAFTFLSKNYRLQGNNSGISFRQLIVPCFLPPTLRGWNAKTISLQQ